MQIWSLSQMSNDEKENILSQHKELYNGYQTMQPKVSNTQPLYVQDFAKDKVGSVLNNKGELKPYTNFKINESHVMDTCEQCGGTMNEGECSECGWSGQMEETKEGYKTGKLDDIYHEEDLNPSDDFDYVEGGGNSYGTFEKLHHMKNIKNEETATSNAPLSYGKHYNEIEPPYDFKSNGPVGDGGTLRQKNIHEVGFTGGGNAPDFEADIDPAYDFEAEGPIEDTYTIPADDMDLDTNKVKKPYDFMSGGPDNGGDAYPVFEEDGECEECWEKMESAFAESEMDEQDVSGVQGMYGRTKKPYAFVSDGPGKAGPYQTHSWGGEELSDNKSEFAESDEFEPSNYKGEDEDVYWEEDLEPGELNFDLLKFNPEDKSWSEIAAYAGEDEFSHMTESKREDFVKQTDKILEMFERFKRYN